MKRHGHYALRIKKNGLKIKSQSRKRVYTNHSLSASDRTADWSVKSQTLSLLARLLFVNPEKKNQRVQLCLQIFCTRMYSDRVAQHLKSCPKNLNKVYHRLDSLTELIARKMLMTKLNRHNQSIPDSVIHPRSLIT